MSRELFNIAGKRLYLTDSERRKFLAAADEEERQVRTFCYVLAHTGCRISEALQLVGERIDFDAGAIVFESLKKRRRGVYRAVPVPPKVHDMLAMVRHIPGTGFIWASQPLDRWPDHYPRRFQYSGRLRRWAMAPICTFEDLRR